MLLMLFNSTGNSRTVKPGTSIWTAGGSVAGGFGAVGAAEMTAAVRPRMASVGKAINAHRKRSGDIVNELTMVGLVVGLVEGISKTIVGRGKWAFQRGANAWKSSPRMVTIGGN